MSSLPRDSALLVSPMNWKPLGPEDLIGQAARVAKAQVTKARRLASGDRPSASMKLLLYGPPGVGKTSVVEMIARELTGSALAVEDFNGREVTVEVVREWMRSLAYGSLFSRWSVRIVVSVRPAPSAVLRDPREVSGCPATALPDSGARSSTPSTAAI